MNKDQEGITLVALVITIILMLILATVSVTGALNGGLFGYAREARIETRKSEYRKEIQKKMALAEDFNEIQTLCSESELLQGAKYNEYEEDNILFIETEDNFSFMILEDEISEARIINIENGSVTIYPDYYIQNDEKTTYSGKKFFITGATTINTLTIAGDVNNTYEIYMSDLSIQVNSIENTCAFNILEGANVNIQLMKENTLKSGSSCAGLQKSSIDGTLTINGEGNLTAQGGVNGAGIGGGDGNGVASCTNIIINSGTINAISGNLAPGIGAGDYGAGIVDNIVINGGIVNAKGNNAGIGTGRWGKSCSNIIINGGKVEAYSTYESCGIGGHNLNNVKITGGTVNIYTSIASTFPAIGNSSRGGTEVNNIQLLGGNIKLSSKGSILIGSSTEAVSPIDENENEVLYTTITLSGITSETKISEIVFSNYEGTYGTKDMYTYSKGEVYLWLPTGAKVISITAGGKTYTSEEPIVAGETGTFK